MGMTRADLTEYLHRRVTVDPDRGCWLWDQSCSAAGYPNAWDGTVVRAGHRLAYETLVGEIPAGLSVLHRCDVRRCVNPEHLFLGSQADNMADMRAKGRGAVRERQTTCAQGHEMTPANTYATDDGRHRCRTCRTEATRRHRARSSRPGP